MKVEQADIFNGCAYVSGNGQLVIDSHSSDEEHLLAIQNSASQPLYNCRKYVDKLFPDSWLGVTGRYAVNYVVDASGKVAGMMIAFTPSTVSAATPTATQGDLPAASAR